MVKERNGKMNKFKQKFQRGQDTVHLVFHKAGNTKTMRMAFKNKEDAKKFVNAHDDSTEFVVETWIVHDKWRG